MAKLLKPSTLSGFGVAVNNPEEGGKQMCVNVEDTSSGSTAAHNKVTASTNEHEETMDNEGEKMHFGSISIDLEETPKLKRGKP